MIYCNSTHPLGWAGIIYCIQVPHKDSYIPDLYAQDALYDLYDLAQVAGREPCNLHDPGARFLGWTYLCYTEHAQPHETADT